MPDVITLEGLTRRFGPVTAVDDLSFTVGRGEIFGFMGHNGAGKTTTLRMLLGLLAPSAGRSLVHGLDPTVDALEIRRRTGFLPASYALPPEMTARSFLRYVGAMFGMRGDVARRRADALLAAHGLEGFADRRLGTLSTGMAQKVGFAQALVNEPELLLLDEPTSGLDPLGRHDLLTHLRRLADGGATVLFSSHILSDVETLCRRVAILHHGRLVAAGDAAALKTEHHVADMDGLYLALARGSAA
jgi:ABC-2 type transport system ATP-binding protein